jgi:hypothetical protein
MMNRTHVMTALALALILTGTTQSNAAETFQRLKGSQIQARFSGMDLSDGVHWRDNFARDGSLTSKSMGKRRIGKWRVEKDELCIDLGPDSGGCYQVWLAGSRVEFRRDGLDTAILEGALGKPLGSH